MRKFIYSLIFLLTCQIAFAGTVSRFKTYNENDVVTSTNLNGNFDNILTEVNAGLDNDNADVSNGFRFYEVKATAPASTIEGRAIYVKDLDTWKLDTGSLFKTTAILENNQTFTGTNTYSGSNVFSNIDINGGAIDGTPIGNSSKTGASFTTVTADTNITLTNTVTEFSTDGTLGGDSDSALPTEKAVKLYVDTNAGNTELFTSGGTFTSRAGITRVFVTCSGGGGGGGSFGTGPDSSGGGGGGGAYVNRAAVTVTASTGYTVTVGAGGAGSSTVNVNGTAGALSSFVGDNKTISCAAGGPGTAGGAAGSGGSGSGSLNAASGSGGDIVISAGGNGAAEVDLNNGGGGGATAFGNGGDGGSSGAGGDGDGYGSGGGGGVKNSGSPGGDGQDGFVFVEW